MTDLPGRVLLVDDETAFQRLGAAWLRGLGYEVVAAGDGAAAEALLAGAALDVVLLDLSMPPRFLPTPVVVLTGHADHALALRAAELGAWDFLAKPVEPEMLDFVVARAVRKARLDAELRHLRQGSAAEDLGMAARSPVLEAAVHCGALAADLLESELFGHMKGSFTGAHRDQPGLVETAHRGMVFLDEVGEMPPSMQVKLPRFLQDGAHLPVGRRVPKRAEARVVAATHRDLEAMVAAGAFRGDLFYRLRGAARRCARRPCRTVRRTWRCWPYASCAAPHAGFTPDALGWLAGRDWLGNVRELRATVEAAAALAEPGAGTVDAALLRFAAGDPDEDGHPGPAGAGILDAAIADLESRMLRDALAASGGNQSEAARRLGVSRVGLGKKLTRLGLR